MFEGVRAFKKYLRENLCPEHLEDVWGVRGNFSCFAAYLVLTYHHPEKAQKTREEIWQEFVAFVFIFSVDHWYTESTENPEKVVVPTRCLGSLADMWVRGQSDPKFLLAVFHRTLAIRHRGLMSKEKIKE